MDYSDYWLKQQSVQRLTSSGSAEDRFVLRRQLSDAHKGAGLEMEALRLLVPTMFSGWLPPSATPSQVRFGLVVTQPSGPPTIALFSGFMHVPVHVASGQFAFLGDMQGNFAIYNAASGCVIRWKNASGAPADVCAVRPDGSIGRGSRLSGGATSGDQQFALSLSIFLRRDGA